MKKKDIAQAFKRARKRSGMTCREVAAALGNSEKTVSAWEHGSGQPDITTLFQLCEIYDISGLDELVGHSQRGEFNYLKAEERDLVARYRKLTVNSKQIVMSVLGLELNHAAAISEAEKPIQVLKMTKAQVDSHIEPDVVGKNMYVKVFDETPPASYGDCFSSDRFSTMEMASTPYGTEFGVKITGDYMEPKIKDGDLLFIRRQPNIEVDEIGIFLYDGSILCRQLAYRNGVFYLHALNNQYRDIPLADDALYSVGRVIECYSKAKKASAT